MDENTNNAIFNLMQKVVDKLDEIFEKLNQKKEAKSNEPHSNINDEINTKLLEIINYQKITLKRYLLLDKKISDSLKTKNNLKNKEYYLIDKNDFIKPRMIFLILFALITIWSSFKFIPKYFLEKSNLKKDKRAYELFYNYVYLKQFESSVKTSADIILEKIYQNDTVFITEYNLLLKTHQKQVKKNQQLNKIKPFSLK